MNQSANGRSTKDKHKLPLSGETAGAEVVQLWALIWQVCC